ncbi:hypothetical protein COOONC_26796, partial [Cooperia oncophora]
SRDWPRCICPGGYGGPRCNKKPVTKCSHKIYASPNWTRLEDTIGLGRGEQEDFEICHYRIKVSLKSQKITGQ